MHSQRTPFQRFLIMLNVTLVLLILAIGSDILVQQNVRTVRKIGRSIEIDESEPRRIDEEVGTPFSLLPTATPPFRMVPVQKPVTIEIPSIQLFADIVNVGVTPTNVMEVPEDTRKVGWYSLGIRPGETGGAILTAHYDTPTGKPAIFYNLNALNPGDIIYLKMENQEELLFQVQEVLSAPVKTFPTDLIYGKIDDKKLILITCDGVWNPIEKSYSKRLAVFATLWENKTL